MKPLLLTACAMMSGCFGSLPPDPPCSDWRPPDDRPTEVRVTRNMSRRPTEVWRVALDSGGAWVRHGRDVKYFLDGQVKSEETWHMGRLEGAASYWYENGAKEGETNFVDGLPEGISVSWYPTGVRESEKTWKSGKLDGWERRWDARARLSL
jgi:hypothetical protein